MRGIDGNLISRSVLIDLTNMYPGSCAGSCYLNYVLRKIERPQYLGVGASGRLVDFQSAITGKKRTQNPWMPPTNHWIWHGPRNIDNLN